MAFKIAGSMAFKSAAARARPVLLEPIMRVEVTASDDFLGEVMGDLSSRRGHIVGIEARPPNQVVRALVPLAHMFGYATDLRSKTQGRASYSMEFAHYEQAPQSIVETVTARVRA
jgi:elongation factor G